MTDPRCAKAPGSARPAPAGASAATPLLRPLGPLFAAALLGGCSSGPDPCADKSESCLAVQIEAGEAAAKAVQVDRVRALFAVNSGPRRERAFKSPAGAESMTAALPIAFPLLLGTQGGSVQLDVIAELRQTPALLGSGTESVGPGEHKRLVIRLSTDVSNLPVAGPPARRDAGLVVIPGTSPAAALLYGGLDADGQPRGDSWEYRSAAGGFFPITGNAPALRVPTLCADASGQRVLSFQGAGPQAQPLADLWQYAGGVWSPLPTLRGPSPPRMRGSCAVIKEPQGQMRDLALLFGGQESATGPQLNDLLFMPMPAGPTFAQSMVMPPAPLRTARLLADASGTYLVGLEGSTANPLKLWRLDTTALKWAELPTDAATAPSRRTGFATAIDTQSAKIYVFGGRSEAGELQRDLIAYSLAEQRWSPVMTAQQPSAREGAAMVALDGTLLLVGGEGTQAGAPALVSDSWKFTGTDWSPL
ncbi:MAG: kelch repeat-containing protein [Polyangia bacterium]